MLLDFKQFMQKVSHFSGVNASENSEFVEEWIRAYYQNSEEELTYWIRSHKVNIPTSHILDSAIFNCFLQVTMMI